MLHTINIIFIDLFFIYAGIIQNEITLDAFVLVKIWIGQENSDDRGENHF